jgi:long-chain-fatty-acid--[acyl-carrier-protein] ligase
MAVLFRWLARMLLGLRYRVRVDGVAQVAARGRRGILFLPNHPALVDPVMLMSRLHARFRPRPLADQDQIAPPGVRWLASIFRVIAIPDPARYGEESREQVEKALETVAAALRQGDNVIFYPAGRIYRSRLESLGGNRGLELLLAMVPEARVVLVRTTGLWGSGFGRGQGGPPAVSRTLRRGFLGVLTSGVFFAPRRRVAITLQEPEDLPRTAGRDVLNRYLEAFYNAGTPPPPLYVPYSRWERGGARQLPEPESRREAATGEIPDSVRELVVTWLADKAGCPAARIRDPDRLAADLGLDSLAVIDLATWIGHEFGVNTDDTAGWLVVGDALAAAAGLGVATAGATPLQPPPAAWNHPLAALPRIPDGATLVEVFLHQARRGPGRMVLADQNSGGRTYRDLITALLLLTPELRRVAEPHVGILLPASVGATTLTMAVLCAGKTPVLLNWTTGVRNMRHALEVTGVRRVLTSKRLVKRLATQVDGFGELEPFLWYVEDLAGAFTRTAKLGAALRARCGHWAALTPPVMPETAAILFTSGSENLPKAVPLTHANLLANQRDCMTVMAFTARDRMLGFLPPFHSFGLNITLLLPLCAGIPVVYHPNPTEGGTLARLIQLYGITMMIGTPTFVNGILRAAAPGDLKSLRLAVTGAEKCPDSLRASLLKAYPQVVMLEGYGITECSPVVAATRPEDNRPGTIGRPLPSFTVAVVHPETGAACAPDETGMLLVRGPSVFGGYYRHEGASPFVEYDGQQWYRTGDLVRCSADGHLTFVGRLKRFIKLGGEMISLPAIEEILLRHYTQPEDEAPPLAVESTAAEANPEIVLFCVRPIEREEANRQLREAGLSPLHNIRRVMALDAVPLLGTGKVDYRALRARLAAPAGG